MQEDDGMNQPEDTGGVEDNTGGEMSGAETGDAGAVDISQMSFQPLPTETTLDWDAAGGSVGPVDSADDGVVIPEVADYTEVTPNAIDTAQAGGEAQAAPETSSEETSEGGADTATTVTDATKEDAPATDIPETQQPPNPLEPFILSRLTPEATWNYGHDALDKSNLTPKDQIYLALEAAAQDDADVAEILDALFAEGQENIAGRVREEDLVATYDALVIRTKRLEQQGVGGNELKVMSQKRDLLSQYLTERAQRPERDEQAPEVNLSDQAVAQRVQLHEGLARQIMGNLPPTELNTPYGMLLREAVKAGAYHQDTEQLNRIWATVEARHPDRLQDFQNTFGEIQEYLATFSPEDLRSPSQRLDAPDPDTGEPNPELTQSITQQEQDVNNFAEGGELSQEALQQKWLGEDGFLAVLIKGRVFEDVRNDLMQQAEAYAAAIARGETDAVKPEFDLNDFMDEQGRISPDNIDAVQAEIQRRMEQKVAPILEKVMTMTPSEAFLVLAGYEPLPTGDADDESPAVASDETGAESDSGKEDQKKTAKDRMEQAMKTALKFAYGIAGDYVVGGYEDSDFGTFLDTLMGADTFKRNRGYFSRNREKDGGKEQLGLTEFYALAEKNGETREDGYIAIFNKIGKAYASELGGESNSMFDNEDSSQDAIQAKAAKLHEYFSKLLDNEGEQGAAKIQQVVAKAFENLNGSLGGKQFGEVLVLHLKFLGKDNYYRRTFGSGSSSSTETVTAKQTPESTPKVDDPTAGSAPDTTSAETAPTASEDPALTPV